LTRRFSMLYSGPSCSGKTTITRVLQQLVKHSLVVYQDDYFKASDIPIDPVSQLENWDCPEALDFEGFVATIKHVQVHGRLPDGYKSNEVENTHDGSGQITAPWLDTWRRQYALTHPDDEKEDDTLWLIVDGFMLLSDERVQALLDHRFFVTASYATLKTRRSARQGYHTLEGYWTDPPGYFDAIVWPEYLRAHKHLLDNGQNPLPTATTGIVVIDTDKLAIHDAIDTALCTLWPLANPPS
ncbi:P-loop containing nucleoside triphosphate hydrolase protein, partial [Gongronella butleri]